MVPLTIPLASRLFNRPIHIPRTSRCTWQRMYNLIVSGKPAKPLGLPCGVDMITCMGRHALFCASLLGGSLKLLMPHSGHDQHMLPNAQSIHLGIGELQVTQTVRLILHLYTMRKRKHRAAYLNGLANLSVAPFASKCRHRFFLPIAVQMHSYSCLKSR